jgi:ankyrin repeat protein
MHLAAQKGKHLRLRPFLSGDVNALDGNDETALYLAAFNGHLRCVNMLLEAKANVNAISKYGPALFSASEYGHLEVVHALIEAHADVNMTNDGQTALHCASLYRDGHHVVAALLAAGALVDVPDARESPLCTCRSLESLKLLIAAGADLDGSAYGCSTPLYTSARTSNITTAKILLDAKADVNYSGKDSQYPILAAVGAGDVEMVKLFISAGADLTVRNSLKMTCLHELVTHLLHDGTWSRSDTDKPDDTARAYECDYPGVFQILVDAKADISARGSDDATPLHTAAAFNNFEAVNALLTAGADPSDVNAHQETALNIASQYVRSRPVLVSTLLAAGSDVNHVDYEGNTPLIFASQCCNCDILLALIAAGADVNMESYAGETPLFAAVLADCDDTVSVLISAGADLNYFYSYPDFYWPDRTALDLAMVEGYHSVAKILRDAGAMTWQELALKTNELDSIDSSTGEAVFNHHLVDGVNDTEKDNALKLAVRRNDLPAVKSLLVAGVDPSLRFCDMTVLAYASSKGYIDIVKELVDAGANVLFDDVSGCTALQHAARGKHRDVVVLLLAKTKELENANK